MAGSRPPTPSRARDPRDDYDEPLDVAPDEAIDGQVLVDPDELDEIDGRAERETRAPAGRRPSGRTNGSHTATAEPRERRSTEAHGTANAETEDRPLPPQPATSAVRVPLDPPMVLVDPVGGRELTLGAWLQRRWLYGLTYWQGFLLFFLAVALLLTRFIDLGDRAMHHDESMHAKFAWDTFRGQIYKYNPLLHGPFQFLAVGGSFWLFGATEATARAVPAIFGVALVCLTFLWRRWLGLAGWLIAAAIFTFSPSFTYFSRMLREDSYTATWTLLAATGLVGYVLESRAAPHERRRWYYAFCAGLAFAFATKESTYITMFIFGTFMILSFLWEHATASQRRILAGAAGGGVVGAYVVAVTGTGKTALAGLMGGNKIAADVLGALIGMLVGAAIGFAFTQLQREPLPETVSERGRRGEGVTARRRVTASPRRRAAMVEAEGRQRTFWDSFLTLWRDQDGFWGIGTFWGGVIVFFAIFFVLFSSLGTNIFPGIKDGFFASITYWLEQHGVQRGEQPWYYYLLLLSVYETLPFLFGIAATVYYLRLGRGTWLTSFLIWWWALALTIYSWAGEKMPWLIIHIATPLVLLTARYLGELLSRAAEGDARRLWERRIALAALPVLGLWTIHTGWPVNFERPDTPKDMLVYTQSAPDVKKVMADIERISLEQTGNSQDIGVVVQSGTWWPFSWYLRDFKNAEYPANLTAQATKPIVLIAAEDLEKNRPFLQGYTGTKYKMRWWYPEDYRSIPEEMRKSGGIFGYLGRKDVRDGLWKWLIYRETTQPLGSYDFYVYMRDGLAPASAGAGASAGATQGTAQQRVDLAQYTARTVPLNLVASWGQNGRAQGQLNTPRGVAIDAEGNVFVADTLNHRIQKFSRTGQPLASWGTEGAGDGQFKEPMGVAVDAQGNVYVADTWNHRVQKFDGTGRFVTRWLGQGTGFYGPRAVAVDGQANVYVMDTGNKRVQKFDTAGRFLAQFGAEGSGPGQFREPVGLAVTAEGQMYVADTHNRRVQVLDPTGRFVAEWPVAGWQIGPQTYPYLALDPEGNVLITDPSAGRIVKYGPTGEVLAVGGTPGRAAGQFEVPLGIAARDAVYVVDSGNHRVQVVTFGT